MMLQKGKCVGEAQPEPGVLSLTSILSAKPSHPRPWIIPLRATSRFKRPSAQRQGAPQIAFIWGDRSLGSLQSGFCCINVKIWGTEVGLRLVWFFHSNENWGPLTKNYFRRLKKSLAAEFWSCSELSDS